MREDQAQPSWTDCAHGLYRDSRVRARVRVTERETESIISSMLWDVYDAHML